MIACQSVSKSFHGKPALENVSLKVSPGRILGLLGRNGAGKSTLIRILTGQLMPDVGEVQILGRPLRHGTHDFRQDIGVLPDELGLFDDLSIIEHLDLSGRVYGTSKVDRLMRSNQLLQALDLEHGRRTLIRDSSHGMRKKTALALALLHNPKVVFLDEPFEGVDPVAAQNVRAMLLAMSRKGATILLTAHTFGLLEGLVADVAILHNGSLAYHSTQDETPSNLSEIFFSITGQPRYDEMQWLG
jgi:ABC-2 type transport system ATP-binding protein